MIGLEETHRGGERAMCISIQQDALTAELYVSVRDAVGFYHYDREDARMALDGGLYSVVAYVDGQVAGIGRVIGDGRIAFFIKDLVVLPQYQGVESVRRCCAHLSHAFENTAATMRTLA